MNGKRKITLVILSILATLFLCMGLVACGTVSINTKTPKATYRIGDNVDCFDFFEYKSGISYSFTLKIDGGDSEKVEGHTAYLAVPGVYKLTCTATRGNAKATKSVEFNVYNKTSHMILTNTEAQVDLGSVRSMRNVMSLSGYIVLSEVEHEEYISTVKIYNNANGTPTIYDLGYDIEKEEGVETADGFYNGRRFNFIYECEYVFTIVSETSGGKSTSDFTVTAKENFDNIPLLENGTISYDENTRVVSWGAIDDAVSYRVKVDLKSVEVGNTLSLDIDEHLVKEFQFFDLVIVAKNAAGEEFVRLVVEDVVTAPAGSENMVIGDGAMVDAENKTVTLSGKQASEASSSKGISKLKNSYVAYAGDYGVGTYVDFTFTGNNLPNVCLFADEINENMSSDGGTGYLLMNGLYSEHRGVSVSPTAIIGENALICAYPVRMRIGGGISDPLHNYIAASEQYSKYKVSIDTLFTQKYLRDDTSARTYRYVVGSFEKYGRLAIEVRLYDASNDQLLEIANYVTDTLIENVTPGNIIVYASVKGMDDNTVFCYSQPYNGTPDDRSIYWQGATENADGSVTLDGAQIAGAGYTSQMTNADGYGFSAMSLSHIGFSGEYGLNTYIDVTFKGNNMPNVMFFADNVNDDITAGGGKGVLIASGMYYYMNANSHDYRGGDNLFVLGPNRIPALYDENNGLSGDVDSIKYGYVYGNAKMPRVGSISYSTCPLLTTKGLLEDVSGHEYKLTLGTYLTVTGNIGIEVILYNVTTQTSIYDTNIATTLTQADVSDGHIILYGAVKGVNEKTTFSYSQPYSSTPDAIKVASSGASRNADGSVTLAGRGVSGAGNLYQITNIDNSYVAITGDYGVGTYMDFIFNGNNMPTVAYFANNINGNMGNADVTLTPTGGYSSHVALGNTGMIFTNGFYMLNTNGGHDFYRIYGMNRIYRESSLSGSYRDDTNYILSKKYGTDTDFNALTQKGLMDDYSTVKFKYTIGTYNDNGKLAIDVTLINLDTNTTVAELKYTTSIDVSTVVADNIIIYGCVKGSTNATTFTYGNPYTKQA